MELEKIRHSNQISTLSLLKETLSQQRNLKYQLKINLKISVALEKSLN